MKFFAYSPSVEAFIQTEDGKVIDVSKDIVRGTVSRRIDAPSTFSLTLSNKKFKYDGVIQPMDKIVIYLTKTKRIQVFSGYVDSAPLLQMYPGDVSISGTCTLKRLANLYWDENSWASNQLYALGTGDQTSDDAGLWKAAVRILTEVAKWPEDAIFVGKLPQAFIDWALKMYQTQLEDEVDRALAEKWIALLGTGQSGAAGGGAVPGSIPQEYVAKIQELSAKYGIPAAYICAVVKNESGWRADATNQNTNGTGDYGLMQINTCHKESYPDYFPPKEGWKDGNRSLEIGVKMINGHFKYAQQVTTSGNMDDILINTYRMYNGGRGGLNNPVTLPRAQKVLGFYKDYLKEIGEGTGNFSGQVSAQTSVSVGDTAEPSTQNGDFAPKGQSSGSSGSGSPPCGLYKAPKWPTKSGMPGSKGPGLYGLQQAFSDALTAMFKDAAAAGHKISTTDGGNCWRSYDVQVKLKASKPSLAATPGKSNHGWGLASDLSYGSNSARQWAHQNAAKYGLHFPMDYEPWHIEPHIEKVAGLSGVEYDGKLVGGAGDTTGIGSFGSGASPLAQTYWMLYDLPKLSPESLFFTGRKALINDVPVWNKIRELFNASLRSISSAPDGSIIAWYPDKFGVYSRTPYFIIEDIELENIEITRSDEPLTTHVFTSGVMVNGGSTDDILTWLQSKGVVSIDSSVSAITRKPADDGSSEDDLDTERLIIRNPERAQEILDKANAADTGGIGFTGKLPTELLKAIVNIPNDQAYKYSADYIFSRYGARPLRVPGNNLLNNNSPMPFLIALWTFMEKWTEQYQAHATFTFMPELFPGGRIKFASQDLEMYVESVTHTFDYSSGFETSADLSCPVSDKRPGFARSQVPIDDGYEGDGIVDLDSIEDYGGRPDR